jgi:hypothetical protein
LLTTQAQRSPNVSGADSDPLIAWVEWLLK